MVITALVLSVGLLLVQSMGLELRYILIAGMALLSWVLSAWSLREGLSGIEWLTVPLPASLFTASVGLFYILLPQEWWARAVIALVFAVGQYALLLTGNIFSVAAIRTIALFRAASAVGFVMTLVTGFFLFDTIYSFKLHAPFVGLLVMVVSFALILPALWSVELLTRISKRVWAYTMGISFSLGVMAMAVTFWPVSIAVASLFLSTIMYALLGISQHHFADRLFGRTVWEYVTVGLVVTVTMMLTAGWGV